MGICVTYFFNSLQYLFRCLGRGRNACPTPVKTWQGVQSFRSNVLTQLFLAHYYQAALVYLMYDIDSFPIQLWGCSRRLLRSWACRALLERSCLLRVAAKWQEHHWLLLCLLPSLILGTSDDSSSVSWKNFATLGYNFLVSGSHWCSCWSSQAKSWRVSVAPLSRNNWLPVSSAHDKYRLVPQWDTFMLTHFS